MLEIAVVLILLCIAGMLSIWNGWLTWIAAVVMVIMGVVIDCAFGLSGLGAIFLFFLTANLVGKGFQAKDRKAASHRNVWQVLANGAVPFCAAVGALIWPSFFWTVAFLSAIAEATADTWASEIGSAGKRRPFHIILWKRVPAGLSGAVTFRGSLSALIGSAFIAFYSDLVLSFQTSASHLITVFIALTVIGWGGQWIDTLLGGLFQARYRCVECGQLTDHMQHCEHETDLEAGFPWMTNNLVNGLSSVLTAAIGGGILLWLI